MDVFTESLTLERALALGALIGVLAACTWIGFQQAWRIPNSVTYPAIVASALSVVVWQDSSAHLVAGAGVFLTLMLISFWRPHVIGMGPAKLAAPIGFVLGPPAALVVVAATVTGSLHAWLRTRAGRSTIVGAAPHLLGATALATIAAVVG